MGLHWDYRLVHGDKAYSWATKKEMPEPGKATLLFEQPVHTSHYALSDRVEIPAGQYGAGTTTLDFVRKAKIYSSTEEPDKLVLETKDGQKFLIKKMKDGKFGDKAWLFKNLTKEAMSNKYLTKIAGFFSNPEKDYQNAAVKYFVDTHNLYGDHFNPKIKEINAKYPKVDDSTKDAYVGEIDTTMRSNAKMKAAHKGIYDAFAEASKKAGKPFPSHDEAWNMWHDEKKRQYLANL